MTDDDDDEPLALEPRAMYDPAIVGLIEQGGGRAVLYSRAKVLAAIRDDGASEEDAIDHYDYNVNGSGGPRKPWFLIDDGPEIGD